MATRDQPILASHDLEILAIGAANMDISASSAQPLMPHDSNPGRIQFAPGGVARNVAENLARLGHRVRLVSVVGADAIGARLLEATRLAGVDVQGCQVLAGQASASYLSLHGPDGDMAVAVNDMAILGQINPQRLAVETARLRDARAVLLDCNLSDAALEWIFGHAAGAAVFAEPVSAFKCRRLLPWLHRVHTLKANRLEVQALTGLPAHDEAGLQAAAQWLHARGVAQVVLSLGAQGAYWSVRGDASPSTRDGVADSAGATESASGWQRALPVAVVNASGAGDAMMAALVHGYLHGDSLAASVAFATGCAAMTLGVGPANHPELSVGAVRQLLRAQGE